jgi:hypothetical protein
VAQRLSELAGANPTAVLLKEVETIVHHVLPDLDPAKLQNIVKRLGNSGVFKSAIKQIADEASADGTE